LAYCLHGAAYGDVDIYVMINASPKDLDFGIYEGTTGCWRRAIDTAQPSPQDIFVSGQEVVVQSPYYRVKARSVVVLLDGQHPTIPQTSQG